VYLFGALRIATAGRALPLSAPPRTGPLLAYLALHEAPQDRRTLAAALWPDSDPDEARANLRRHLHYLKQALPEAEGTPWLRTDGSHVRLEPAAPVWIDVRAFEDAVRAGELEAAVALYADHLLPEIDDEWLLAERERLRSTFVAALASLAERHAEAGRAPEALAVLERLLQENPLREDAVRMAMRVRYAGGDRAGALSTFERFARWLEGELGVEPMRETRALFETMVRELEPPPVSGRTAAAAPPQLPFVGRAGELAELMRLWKRAREGAGGLVLLAGPAGVGKSRLLARLARQIESEDGRALTGATSGPETGPYQAFGDALRPVFPLLTSSGSLNPVWRRALAAALPGVGPEASGEAPLRVLPPERERARLFHAATRAFQDLARTRPLLLVLEDVHEAGDATIALLEHLARHAHDARLLIVASYREHDLRPDHPLHDVRRRLEADGGLRHLALGGLETQAVATLLARTLPQADISAAELAAVSAGNPLLISELLYELARPGPSQARTATPSTVAPLAVPGSVRSRVAARLEDLDAGARTLAAAAAVHGETFRLDAVRDMLAWNERDALDALDRLLDARLVREQRTGQFAFGHRLMQEAIYQGIDPATRSRYHRRAAHALERHGDSTGRAATMARHLDRAGDADGAARYALQAAREALAVGAGEEASALAGWALERAREPQLRLAVLQLAEEAARRRGDRERQQGLLDGMETVAAALGDADGALDATARRVVLLHALGDRDGEREQLASLAARAGADGRPTWLARTALLRAEYALATGDAAAAEGAVAEAAALADEAGDGRLATAAACLAVHAALAAGRVDEARTRLDAAERAAAVEPELLAESVQAAFRAAIGHEAYEEAYALTGRLVSLAVDNGDRGLEAEAHQYRAVSAARLTRLAEARAHYRIAEGIYRELGQLQGLAAVSLNRGILELRLGITAAAERLADAARIFARLGDRRGEMLCLLNGSVALLYEGRYHEARDAAGRALERARASGNDVLMAAALNNLGDAERHLGLAGEAIEHLCRAVEIERRLQRDASSANALCELALTYLQTGRIAEAATAADDLVRLLDVKPNELMHPQQVAWVASRVRLAQGDGGSARALARRASLHLDGMVAAIADAEARTAFLALEFNREILAADNAGPPS